MTRRIVSFVIACIILLIGFKFFEYLSKNKRKRLQKQVLTQKIEVRTITLRRKTIIPQIHGFGTSRGKREITLTTENDGKIIKIGKQFQSGLMINKGDLLVKIDSESTEIKIRKIRAELEKIKVSIEKLKQEKKNIYAKLKINEERIELVSEEFEKNSKLFKKGIISEMVRNSSEKNYLSQREQKINLESQLSLVPIKIDEQKTLTAMKKAELSQEELRLKKSVIYSPLFGLVGEKNIETSQFVRAGTSFGTILDLSYIEIPVSLGAENFRFFNFHSLSDILKKKKIPVKIFWQAGKEKNSWQGFVSRFEKIDEKTRTIEIIVEVKQDFSKKAKSLLITKGMFCEVSIPGKTFEDVVFIPINALRDSKNVYVYDNGRLDIRTPEIDERFNDIAVIKNGLEDGEKVIVSYIKNPVNGMELAEKTVN